MKTTSQYLEIPIPAYMHAKLARVTNNDLEGKVSVDGLANVMLSYILGHKRLLLEVIEKIKARDKR